MEEIQNKVIKIMNLSGKEDAEIERDLHLPRSTVYDWRHGRSRSYKNYITELSNYFGVTADYFYGTEQKNKPAAESDELKDKIADLFTQLSPDGKKELIEYARYKVEHQKEK